jgi:plasmid stability protein
MMRTRLNIDLRDEGLYKAIKIQAVEKGTSVRKIVEEALRQWLRSQSETERHIDRAAVKRLSEVRERVFGDRVLPGSSAALIQEAREERLSRL